MSIEVNTKVRVKDDCPTVYRGRTGVVIEDISPWDYPYLVFFENGGDTLFYAEAELEVLA